MDFLTEEAGIDICGDETRWSTSSYVEAGKGVTGGAKNKPGVIKGGQNILLNNVNKIRPLTSMHIHKLHSNPTGWTVMGNIEVKISWRI